MSTNKIKHIGVFTSGGDSPGMNATLYAIAKTAEANGIKISGFRKGYEGLIDGDLIPLKSQELKKITQKDIKMEKLILPPQINLRWRLLQRQLPI